MDAKGATDTAAQLYGDVLTPELRAACLRYGKVLGGFCLLGAPVQLVATGVPQIYILAIVVYFLYNISCMVLVRISNAAFKFEDKDMLLFLFRVCCVMVLYNLIVAVTLPAWKSEKALMAMGLGGLVNALVALPTEMREAYFLISARQRGIGLEGMKELSSGEKLALNCFLAFVITLCFVVYANVLAVHVIGDGHGPQFNSLLVFYMLNMLVPFVAPKFFHLMQTEPRVWPLKLMLFNFGQAFVALFAIGSCVGKAKAHSFQVTFGVMGTINGVLIALMFAAISYNIMKNPRTDQDKASEAKAALKDDGEVTAPEV